MRSFLEIRALVSEDQDQQKSLLKGLFAVDDSDVTTFASHRKILPAEEVDYEVPFGGVAAASGVLILAYQEIAVKFEGTGSPAVPVRPKVAASPALSLTQSADQPGLVLWLGEVTSIHVSNPSLTEEATFFVALIGEAS